MTTMNKCAQLIFEKMKNGQVSREDARDLLAAIKEDYDSAGARDSSQPIAIVGLAGRYPDADNLQAFWRNLRDGRDSVSTLPHGRWPGLSAYGDAAPGAKIATLAGGFMADVDGFDPRFFNISPRDAEMMDPQERLFLMAAWHAIEDAGYTRTGLAGSSGHANVGVFAGVMWNEYSLVGLEAALHGQAVSVSSSPASIANRVSYTLNLFGPSMAVDTQCSSSLSAIHLACQAIRGGECDAALAGGVNLSLHPNKFFLLSQGQFLSRSGRCNSFSSQADGIVIGEGVGCVLLKRLDAALADGDRIYAVIKGSALNHGGKTNGYTVPNPRAQELVVGAALRAAGVAPADVGYIEAHGTGTALGDPIEIAALSRAFGAGAGHTCAIGSVKSNIGHCESAAGIAGLTKVLLQLRHGELAPSLHFAAPNAAIDFARTPFRVQDRLAPWPAPPSGRRVAGVSSFGAGGANAHLLVEEYLGAPATAAPLGEVLLPLSAANPERLRVYAAEVADWLATLDPLDHGALHDLAYTFQVGREPLGSRVAYVAASAPALRERLLACAAGSDSVAGTGAALAILPETIVNRPQVAAWLQAGALAPLAQAWCEGEAVDWRALRRDGVVRRVAAPLYPFARERYWAAPGLPAPSALTAERQSEPRRGFVSPIGEATPPREFMLDIPADHPVLQQHRVQDQPLCPGVGVLDGVREALQAAYPGRSISLLDAVWVAPLKLQAGAAQCAARIVLEHAQGQVDQKVSFKVLGEGAGALYCQGRVAFDRPAAHAAVDVAALRARLDPTWERADAQAGFYADIAAHGIGYGPFYRNLAGVWMGAGEALGLLAAAAAPDESQRHVALLDAALHCVIPLVAASAEPALSLPFAVGEVVWARPLGAGGYVHIEQRDEATFDIAVLDEVGRLCVAYRGFKIRKLPLAAAQQQEQRLTPGPAQGQAQGQAQSGDIHYVPVWVRKVLDPAPQAAEGPTLVCYRRGGHGVELALQERYPGAVLADVERVHEALAAMPAAPARVLYLGALVGSPGTELEFAL